MQHPAREPPCYKTLPSLKIIFTSLNNHPYLFDLIHMSSNPLFSFTDFTILSKKFTSHERGKILTSPNFLRERHWGPPGWLGWALLLWILPWPSLFHAVSLHLPPSLFSLLLSLFRRKGWQGRCPGVDTPTTHARHPRSTLSTLGSALAADRVTRNATQNGFWKRVD